MRRPHIVIFNPDHFRGDALGHTGNPAAVTPNLDRMAAEDGVSFTSAFCQNGVCVPSRCSFMTGWYPHVAGHRSFFHMLRPHEPVLLQKLKDSGYFVWWGGKNDLVAAQHDYDRVCDVRYCPNPPPLPPGPGPNRGEPGSDTYYSFFVGRRELPPGEKIYRDSDWANVLGAIDFIKDAPADRPLCIVLTLNWPHPFYRCEEPFFSMIDRSRMPPRIPTPPEEDLARKPSMIRGLLRNYNMVGWSEERWTELRATAYAMCARVDHQFGLVMQALKDAGMYDDTAVFFFSDHAEFLGDYGLVSVNQNTFEDSLLHVPLVIKPPAGVPVAPGARDALVELVDFPATVYAMTGVEACYSHFGRSLLPAIADPAARHRDAVFAEGGRLEGESHCMERESAENQVPTGHYWPRLSLQLRLPEHTKAAMCRTRDFKYVRRLYEQDELYDLRSDPRELHNRIDDPALAGELARLKERMLTWLLETGDVVPFEPDRR